MNDRHEQNPAYSTCVFLKTMNTSYKEITDCLKHLIDTQDFIVIPNFGALVMQMEPAEFSISQNVIFPPRKKILFNPLLTHNDGLLISELQKQLGIEFVLAQTMVNQFVESIKVLLDTKRRVDLEGIGFFYKDMQENILFESSINPFYLSESFGLYPLHAAPLEKENTFADSEKNTKKPIIRFDTKNIYRAAAVLIIAGLLLAYWILPFKIKDSLASIAGKNPVVTPVFSKAVYPVIRTKFDEIKPFIRKEKEIHTNENNIENNTVSNSLYSIIAGCFKVEQNAKKLFNEFKNKGVEASVKWDAQKQLYVVSVGSFNDKSKATDVLNTLKSNRILKDAWIKEEK